MKGFSEEVRQDIFNCQNGKCKVLNCYEDIVDFHHKISNTKVNQKLYPNLIQGIYNIVGLCRECHINRSHLFRLTDKEALCCENYLNEFAEKHYQRGLKDAKRNS